MGEIGVASSRQIISFINRTYPERPWKLSTIRAHIIGCSINHSSSHHYPGQPKFLFTLPSGRVRLYDPNTDNADVDQRGEPLPIGELFGEETPTKNESFEPRRRWSGTVEDRISRLIENFSFYLDVYDRDVPFNEDQFRLHAYTIQKRKELGTAAAALADDTFLDLLHATLRQWGIGVRASRLLNQKEFNDELRSHSNEISSLDNINIDGYEQEVNTAFRTLESLFTDLAIVENKARLVAVSKTLHHLLPDLVPPIDREYTGRFFGWHGLDFQDHQGRLYRSGFHAFRRIALAVAPEQFIGQGWRTSRTKILDNAIIGSCIHDHTPKPS